VLILFSIGPQPPTVLFEHVKPNPETSVFAPLSPIAFSPQAQITTPTSSTKKKNKNAKRKQRLFDESNLWLMQSINLLEFKYSSFDDRAFCHPFSIGTLRERDLVYPPTTYNTFVAQYHKSLFGYSLNYQPQVQIVSNYARSDADKGDRIYDLLKILGVDYYYEKLSEEEQVHLYENMIAACLVAGWETRHEFIAHKVERYVEDKNNNDLAFEGELCLENLIAQSSLNLVQKSGEKFSQGEMIEVVDFLTSDETFKIFGYLMGIDKYLIYPTTLGEKAIPSAIKAMFGALNRTFNETSMEIIVERFFEAMYMHFVSYNAEQ
jgi:hypothetical protein